MEPIEVAKESATIRNKLHKKPLIIEPKFIRGEFGTMPTVKTKSGTKHYAYTAKGKAAAKQAAQKVGVKVSYKKSK